MGDGVDVAAASRDELLAVIAAQAAELEELRRRVAELEAGSGGGRGKAGAAPVKPNAPADRERKPTRRPGAAGHGRPRSAEAAVTRRVRHALAACPECGEGLAGGWVHRTREVVDLAPAAAEVTVHEVVARVCPRCAKRRLPRLDLGGAAAGRGRIGVRAAVLVAWLRAELRLPLGQIGRYLAAVHGLGLSRGEIVALLRRAAKAGEPAAEALLAEARSGPVLHVDETGWREDGRNGWLWTAATPTARYYRYAGKRDKAALFDLVGAGYGGTLVSDCFRTYCAFDGLRAKCWAHLLRDLDALREAHPGDPAVARFVRRVVALYRRGVRWLRAHPGAAPAERRAAARALTARLEAEVEPLCRTPGPRRPLAERIERYSSEWFVFVADPAVPATNNAAERSLRPEVVGRKVSGGTRSPAGTATRFTLASLFGSWKLRGDDPLEACAALLRAPPSPQPHQT